MSHLHILKKVGLCFSFSLFFQTRWNHVCACMRFTCYLAQSAWLWTPLHLHTLWEPQRSAFHLCVFVPLIMLRKKRVLWATLGAGCRLPTPSEDDNSTAKTKWFFLTPARSWNQPRSIEKEQSGNGAACLAELVATYRWLMAVADSESRQAFEWSCG